MPQLDTTNWLHMFFFTWLTLLITMKKITSMNMKTKPTITKTTTNSQQWIWPW